jgi:hypothetical protein
VPDTVFARYDEFKYVEPTKDIAVMTDGQYATRVDGVH